MNEHETYETTNTHMIHLCQSYSYLMFGVIDAPTKPIVMLINEYLISFHNIMWLYVVNICLFFVVNDIIFPQCCGFSGKYYIRFHSSN